jgi:hypothetical protein
MSIHSIKIRLHTGELSNQSYLDLKGALEVIAALRAIAAHADICPANPSKRYYSSTSVCTCGYQNALKVYADFDALP